MTEAANRISPFVTASAVLHGGLFAALVFAPTFFARGASESWGNSSNRNIKVGVTGSLPAGIPLPSPPVVNENAKGNPSKTLHPAEPTPKAPKSSKAPSKSADIKIPERGARNQQKTAPTKVANANPVPDETPNAIPGASSGRIPLPFGQVGGTGQATFGGDGTFGTRFPAFVTAMNTAIQSKWEKAGGANKQRVYVTFTIHRNGRSSTVSDVKIDQTSGNAALDRSALRAIMAATLPALPPDFSGNSVDVRFYFEQP